jgi:hypothetical protein
MNDDSQDDTDREKRASDVPLDLVKEREVFVRTFLKKGVEYTEHLLNENEQLRDELHKLRDDNARLRAHVASDDAIRDLLRTIEGLEKERRDLIARSEKLERTRREHEGRQAEIEQEVNDLANLYIASYQLHAGLSVRRVVRHLRDMCGQLVGALGFVIYLLHEDRTVAYPIAWEGVRDEDVGTVTVGEGPVGEAIVTGVARIREAEGEALIKGTQDDPVAVVPLIVEGQTIGAISIVSLLEQKSHWASVDRELLQLLGTQAGVALIAANQYAGSISPVSALTGLEEKL